MATDEDLALRRITELPLKASIASKLARRAILSIGELTALCDREVLSIDGIGYKSLEEIQKALAHFGLELAEDEYGSLMCARHNKKRNDTRIRSYFLCEDCGVKFETQALHNAHPIFRIKIDEGEFFCSNCNEKKVLSLYQWYICDVCDRVLRSIGRGLEADRGIIKWWNNAKNHVEYPLVLRETDPPQLEPINGGGDGDDLDFKWMTDDSSLFGAEIKTGRNHLSGGNIGSGMSRFQLDVSDIESILSSMEKRDPFIPAYLFHCQVVDIPQPPTTKFDCVGIWWTSVLDLINSIEEIKQRPRENRPAAYINTTVFNQIDSFVDEMNRRGYLNCPSPAVLREKLTAF